MLSKRKRAARRHGTTAADLLDCYTGSRNAARDGEHVLLRWLVRARHITAQHAPAAVEMDALATLRQQTGMLHAPTREAMDTLEQRVAAHVMRTEHCLEYLQYFAEYFRWHYTVLDAASTPRLAVAKVPPGATSFLTETSLSQALVVPDVRRSAIRIMQVLSVRPGEIEVAAYASTVRSRSCSAVLQLLRTPEWNARVQHTLMYGSLTDIYNAGMLDAVYFAVVDGRYQGRVSFAWCEKVLITPGQGDKSAAAPWPVIYCSCRRYIVVWQGHHAIYPSALHAYEAWLATCLQLGGIIGGHYDVRKCTI